MTDMTQSELQLYIGLVAVSNLLLGLGMIFRTDDLVKVIKKKFEMRSWEHLPLRWMSGIGAVLNLLGSYLAFTTGAVGACIMWAAWKKR